MQRVGKSIMAPGVSWELSKVGDRVREFQTKREREFELMAFLIVVWPRLKCKRQENKQLQNTPKLIKLNGIKTLSLLKKNIQAKASSGSRVQIVERLSGTEIWYGKHIWVWNIEYWVVRQHQKLQDILAVPNVVLFVLLFS